MATETSKLTFVEGAAASTPAANRGVVYFKADGLLYSKDDAGTETLCSSGAVPANVLTTTGDIIYSSSGTTAARRAIGSTADVLTVTGGVPVWAAPAAGSLSSFQEVLSADLTMTNANQYYDALTHSCAAGTWLFAARLHFISSGSNTHVYTSKIYESGGPTVWDEAESTRSSLTDNGWYYQSTNMAIVVLGGTTTVRLASADVRASNVVTRETDTNSATSHMATKFIGIKIA